MDDTDSDLYRWQRLTKPRVYSRSQRVATTDDIQDWIKTVEDASSSAAAAAFGGEQVSHKQRGKNKVKAAVTDAHIHEAAYSEAQDLLNQWVSEKIHFDAGLEDDAADDEEIWSRHKTAAEVKKQWDDMIPDDAEDYAATEHVPDPSDIYRVLKQDDSAIVDSIIERMLDKPVVKKEFTADLGLDDDDYRKTPDPRTKMHLRHQMVKENREKRMNEKKKKLQELQIKKDTQFKARQLVQQEEQQKSARKKQEEQELLKEMAKVRKQMEDEKKKQQEEALRDKREKDAFERKAQEEYARQREIEQREQRKAHLMAEERQRNIMNKIEEIEIKQAGHNLKCLQRHFSAWYNVVVERRIQYGRARATADWKLLLRTWNAWKAYTRSKNIDRETQSHEQQIRAMQRREASARDFHKRRLLRRCFLAWQLYTHTQISAKEVSQSKLRTKSKMAAFLEAAATGKLGQEVEEIGRNEEEEQKVNDIFRAGKSAPPAIASSRSSQSTSRSEITKRQKPGTPTQAWQITRHHAHLTKKQINTLNQGQGQTSPTNKDTARTDQSESSKPESKPWEKKPFAVDNYANRHLAQQKILDQQQKQIKEQQRLIEELTYLQKQQMLQQQLLQTQTQVLSSASQQNGRQIQDGRQTQSGGQLADDKALQQHIEKLQRELISKNQNLDALQLQLEKSPADTDRSDLTQISSAATSVRSRSSEVSSKSSAVSQKTTDSKHLSFLKSMEERANERARIKKERDDKRRQEDEEKIRRLQEEEEELRRQQEEEKRRRAEMYREKKRLDKEREEEKQHQAERLRQLTIEADAQHLRGLVKYRGWLPWCRLMEITAEHRTTAQQHHGKTLLRKCLLSWHNMVQKELEQKKAMADHYYHYMLVRRCFQNWRKYGEVMSIQEDKAVRHYEARIKHKVLQEWADATAAEKVSMWHKERAAKEHNVRRIQLTCLRAWRRFPRVLKEETAREKRMNEMRQKVASMLPDYSLDASTKSHEFL